jgi:hypothetical protein
LDAEVHHCPDDKHMGGAYSSHGVNRRGLLCQTALIAGLAALATACSALQLGSVGPRQIAVLAPDDGTGPRWDAFRAGLCDLGWREGQNLVSSWRAANGVNDVLNSLAVDLVSQGSMCW